MFLVRRRSIRSRFAHRRRRGLRSVCGLFWALDSVNSRFSGKNYFACVEVSLDGKRWQRAIDICLDFVMYSSDILRLLLPQRMTSSIESSNVECTKMLKPEGTSRQMRLVRFRFKTRDCRSRSGSHSPSIEKQSAKYCLHIRITPLLELQQDQESDESCSNRSVGNSTLRTC